VAAAGVLRLSPAGEEGAEAYPHLYNKNLLCENLTHEFSFRDESIQPVRLKFILILYIFGKYEWPTRPCHMDRNTKKSLKRKGKEKKECKMKTLQGENIYATIRKRATNNYG
jgi:hypothetical protein